MSYDLELRIHTGVGMARIDTGRGFNYTYNVRDMLEAVGIVFNDLRGKPMSEVSLVFNKGIAKLKKDPEKYKAMNPENGWGSYETLVPFMEEMNHVFSKHPKATFRVF